MWTGTDALDVLASLPKGTRLACDTETAGTTGLFTRPTRIRAIGFYSPHVADGNALIVLEEDLFYEERKGVVRAAVKRLDLIGHNVAFDWPVMKHHGMPANFVADTMLKEYRREPRRIVNGQRNLRSLGFLAEKFLNVMSWKSEVEDYDNDPYEKLLPYLCLDLWATWGLDEFYGEHRLDAHLVTACKMLADARTGGMQVDPREVEPAIEALTTVIDRESSKWGINLNSPKQVKELLHDRGIKVSKTDRNTLEVIDDPFAESVLVFRESSKLYSSFFKKIDTLVDPHDGAIHPEFHADRVETGRLSCSGPNIQQFPPPATTMLVAGEGRAWAYADVNAAELRVMALEIAYITDDTSLLDAINSGEKVPKTVASRAFGGEYTEKQYVMAKQIVYGLPYGRSTYAIAKAYHMEQEEADAVAEEYLTRFPGILMWQEHVMGQVARGEFKNVETFTGRRYPLPDPKSREAIRMLKLDPEIAAQITMLRDNPGLARKLIRMATKMLWRKALAFYPQSTASDIVVCAAIQLWQQGYDVRALVHDSLTLNVGERRAPSACRAIEGAILRAGQQYVEWRGDKYEIEFLSESGSGQSWYEAKSK